MSTLTCEAALLHATGRRLRRYATPDIDACTIEQSHGPTVTDP
jgi:hypothetical protein